MTDPLRPFWDFDDLDATEARFHVLRAEILTQLARVHGLRDDFAAGDRLLDEAAATESPVLAARVALERGRLRRSSGDAESALPLFERAFAVANETGETFLAIDAAHMAAIVAPATEDREEWARRGIALAEESDVPDVRRWLGSLWNNVGWDRFERGDHADALTAFEQALQAYDQGEQLQLARYAVAKALRALGRANEAIALLELAVAETPEPDGWFHHELAESYTAIGDETQATEHARIAANLRPDGGY
ncbi:tetratricopeptide repeat protein [Tenggerimyces flavus]|uniref:Tetratricopeptide repeat protein n=1 Tax=Tenggerimyces flavus TaxID=1708749 RepID=A0ABV7YAD9_9ACTN|nr:tetratricopeptide repeat protein [Tenggerimyces flavus]MBM7785462.1 tetratricopeptide (TPR) repeat protein [Tenggerimyces flavus]